MSVAVKICGVCRVEDAAFAAACGADYIGVILAPGRERTRTLERAAEIFEAAAGVRRVGVFVDAAPEAVLAAADRLALDVVQLHGGEPPDVLRTLRSSGRSRVWKAIRPRDGREFVAGVEAYGAVVDALLLDGWSWRGVGGTGTRFPWREIAGVRDRVPSGVVLVVAGGLEAGNVAEAVARLSPHVVDVSSGVERRVGEKDPDRVRAFIAAARSGIHEAAAPSPVTRKAP